MADLDVVYKPIQFIRGVGPRRAKLLERLGLRTVDDLLHHLPAKYYDRREMTPLAEVRGQATATIQGVVSNIRAYETSGRRMPVLEVTLEDGESRAVLV